LEDARCFLPRALALALAQQGAEGWYEAQGPRAEPALAGQIESEGKCNLPLTSGGKWNRFLGEYGKA